VKGRVVAHLFTSTDQITIEKVYKGVRPVARFHKPLYKANERISIANVRQFMSENAPELRLVELVQQLLRQDHARMERPHHNGTVKAL
jgi:hypothetical protein